MLKFFRNSSGDVYMETVVDGKTQRTLLEAPLGVISEKTTKVQLGDNGPESYVTCAGAAGVIPSSQRGAAMAVVILREYAGHAAE